MYFAKGSCRNKCCGHRSRNTLEWTWKVASVTPVVVYFFTGCSLHKSGCPGWDLTIQTVQEKTQALDTWGKLAFNRDN